MKGFTACLHSVLSQIHRLGAQPHDDITTALLETEYPLIGKANSTSSSWSVVYWEMHNLQLLTVEINNGLEQ